MTPLLIPQQSKTKNDFFSSSIFHYSKCALVFSTTMWSFCYIVFVSGDNFCLFFIPLSPEVPSTGPWAITIKKVCYEHPLSARLCAR